jgi:hypothetical protein
MTLKDTDLTHYPALSFHGSLFKRVDPATIRPRSKPCLNSPVPAGATVGFRGPLEGRFGADRPFGKEIGEPKWCILFRRRGPWILKNLIEGDS